jgi:hypothetical protein
LDFRYFNQAMLSINDLRMVVPVKKIVMDERLQARNLRKEKGKDANL